MIIISIVKKRGDWEVITFFDRVIPQNVISAFIKKKAPEIIVSFILLHALKQEFKLLYRNIVAIYKVETSE